MVAAFALVCWEEARQMVTWILDRLDYVLSEASGLAGPVALFLGLILGYTMILLYSYLDDSVG